MRRLTFAFTLVLVTVLAAPARGQEEQVPCYTCRTSECPSLDAPPCPPQKKKKGAVETAEEKARREKEKAEKAARDKAEQEKAAQAEKERAAQEQAEKERAAQEAARQERLRQERLRQEQARVEAERQRQARHAGLRRGKWAALTTGLLLTGAGVALLALDNRMGRDCWMPGDTSTCRETLRLHYGGAPLLAVGGAALVSAAILFGVDAKRGRYESGAPR